MRYMDYHTRVAEALKKVLLGHLISEMGLYQLPIPYDSEILKCAHDAGIAIKKIQNIYERHPQSGEDFKRSFSDERNLLYAQILGRCYCLPIEDLIEIDNELKRNFDDTNP